MRPVYIIAGGITKFAKANPAKDFRLMVKEAFDSALADLGGKLTVADIEGSVIAYFSDHFTFQLKAGAMVQDFVGLCPKPHVRIEGGGATGGLCLQQAWEILRSEEHTSELQSRGHLVCRLLLEKKKKHLNSYNVTL